MVSNNVGVFGDNIYIIRDEAEIVEVGKSYKVQNVLVWTETIKGVELERVYVFAESEVKVVKEKQVSEEAVQKLGRLGVTLDL